MQPNNNDYLDRIQAMSRRQRMLLAQRIAAVDPDFQHRSTGTAAGITAYVVPANGQSTDAAAMRTSLSDRLPDYMVPTDIVFLDALPLTPSGKVDRKALPAPDPDRFAGHRQTIAPKSRLERELAGIWSEVLNTRTISMTDNFFALGGDSLLAVKFFAMIRSKTGRDLPLALLFEAPTLRDLVNKIEKELIGQRPIGPSGTPSNLQASKPHKTTDAAAVERDYWSALVPIRPEGGLRPLFLMHGIGGNVLNYWTLVPYLNKEQPVYGLQARGLDGITAPFRSVAEMSAHYVSEIQRVQSRGPYLLGGGSMGGAVALEMAQLLRGQGQNILFLGLFDTISPFATFKKKSLADKAKTFRTSGTALPHLLRRKIRYYIRRSRNLFYPPICRFYRSKGQPIPPKFRYWFMGNENRRIMLSHRPRPYPGRITLFRSTFANDEGPDRGWGEIATNGLDIIQIPAHHKTLVESEVLGRELGACLDTIQKRHGDRRIEAVSNQPLY